MAAESRDVLAGLYRVHLRLIRLAAQPGNDRDAVVAKDHEAVVQVAHQPGQLELENVLENLDDAGGFALAEFRAHNVTLALPPRADGKPNAGVSYTLRQRGQRSTPMSGFYDIAVGGIDGTPDLLGPLRGKVALAVNVASRCGLTPQYEGLEQLQRELAEENFTVVGFPCNQFAGQEPGSAEEIASFCRTTYGVSFPL